jgi:hypothetical protein
MGKGLGGILYIRDQIHVGMDGNDVKVRGIE